ncbi:melanoma-associated antigen 10-like [Peromyscus californicus insignis]|uniref:melanoma-associated antigen 10-like n=1 Tax=Peromyscus californicus insignis TaxID=564181 RepID=UPI0022A72752|nr:melanoma-associated antigen 10-like [Peromyscus californicus insignis]
MSRYGKHPRLSLEEGVNFQNPTETDEFPLVPTPEKEEREGEEEIKEEEEEDNNKQKNEEDNKEKEEEEEKGKEDEKEECGDEVNDEENEKGEEEADLASIFFSSSNVSFPTFTPPSPSSSSSSPFFSPSSSPSSSSSSSSSSSFFSLVQSNLGGNEDYAAGMLSIFQNAQSFFPSPTLGENLDEANSHQEESSGAIESPEDPEALLNIVIQEKATDLVFLFIYKYRMKEPITLSEIYEIVTKDYEDHFAVIFIEASKCLEMTFGIDIKESDLLSSAYVFVNSLNLTYEDMLNDNDRLPRNAFLIVILGVIFIEGNRASEERIWEFFKLVGVYDGEEHFICGDPREFLTVDLVQQNYLEYRQVPDSQPPCFEFLWGSRAYAETTKMKVLEFLAKMNGCDPTDFSIWYEEALRDEEERAWAINDSADGSPTTWFLER